MNTLQTLGQRVFSSHEDARKAINTELGDEGLIVSVKHTYYYNNDPITDDVKNIVLVCSCHKNPASIGAGNSEASRKRIRPSRSTGCLFRLKIDRNKERTFWKIVVQHGEHNHPPFAHK